jgi:hypothetical protein
MNTKKRSSDLMLYIREQKIVNSHQFIPLIIILNLAKLFENGYCNVKKN